MLYPDDDGLITLHSRALLSTSVKGVEYTVIGTRKRRNSESAVDVVRIDGAKVVQFDLLTPKVPKISDISGKQVKGEMEKFRDRGGDGGVDYYRKQHSVYKEQAKALVEQSAEGGAPKRAIVVNCNKGRLRTSIMAGFIFGEIAGGTPGQILEKIKASRPIDAQLSSEQAGYVLAALEGEKQS
jgi:hypothetical protein